MEENMGLPERLMDQCADAGSLPALAREPRLTLGAMERPIIDQLVDANLAFDAAEIMRCQKIADALTTVSFARVVPHSVVIKGRDRLAKRIAAAIKCPAPVQEG